MNKPKDQLPEHAYIPGGPYPRPQSDVLNPRAAPIVNDQWQESPEFLSGIRLFNAGYYWEAHEAWEALWHAHQRRGPLADLVKGLIKLAAAGVKIRQRTPAGALTHARRARALFQSLLAEGHERLLGLDLRSLANWAREVTVNVPADHNPPGAAISRVFQFQLEPRA